MKNKKLDEELFSQRVFFKTPQLRDQFFSKLKNHFETWTNLGKQLKIYKSRLERLRSGEISLPYKTFSELLHCLNGEDRNFFLKDIMLKDSMWGRAKGGISTYKKHKEIFENGRKLGCLKLKPKYKFEYTMPLTAELCEFIGAFIGDGFTNKYDRNHIVQITGHRTLDKDYYFNKLIPMIKKLSPSSNPIISEYPDAIRLTINSKEFHLLLTKRFNMKAGKKAYSVVIPDEIVKSKDKNLINRCIRGIFDTDGCVAFDKRATYLKPYMRIVLQMRSVELMKQIHGLLKEQGINSTITKNNGSIQINGIENCKTFVESVGFSNNRHLSKLKPLYE